MNISTKIILTVKAANQKCEDFILECDSNWSIRYLKSHLAINYPAKPNEQTIRLIYSGRLLYDDSKIKDCFRLNNESNIQYHTIHIVYKSSNNNDDENNTNRYSQNESNDLINEEIQNLTQSINSQPQAINNLEQLNPKDRHAYIYNHLKNYYERMGMPISNSWNISYLHHTALYYQMYSNYIQSTGISPPLIPANNTVNQVNNNIEPTLNETQVILNNQQEQVPIFNNNNNNNNNGVDLRGEDRDDDWLSILYNFFSFLLLFCIVYLYSTLTRFIIVLVVITLLYLYQSGWFLLERRVNIRNVANRPNNVQQQPQNENREQPNNAENEIQDVNQGLNEITNPNIFRLIFSFIITFFTSLIPERARIPN